MLGGVELGRVMGCDIKKGGGDALHNIFGNKYPFIVSLSPNMKKEA